MTLARFHVKIFTKLTRGLWHFIQGLKLPFLFPMGNKMQLVTCIHVDLRMISSILFPNDVYFYPYFYA